jgi:hypothetical protein
MTRQINIKLEEKDLVEIEESLPGLRGGPALRTAALLWVRSQKNQKSEIKGANENE